MTELPTALSLRDYVDALIDRVRRDTGVPGIGVALSIDGRRLVVARGKCAVDEPAPITEDARFQLGCVTKLLMSAVALERAEAHQLDMNAPLGEYLAELSGTWPGDTIAVRHLLSHTSGYRGINLFEPAALECTFESFVKYLRESPPFFAPGAVFSYEHSETVLLDTILQRTAGNSGLALIREMIFEPLGINAGTPQGGDPGGPGAGMHDLDRQRHCFKRVQWNDIPAQARLPFHPFWRAAFSDYTLGLRDLLSIGEALLDAPGGARAAPVFGAATRTLMLRPAVALPRVVGGSLAELLPSVFGLGVARLRNGWYGANASSLGQCLGLRFAPSRHAVIVAGLNAALPHLRDLVLAALCGALGPIAAADETEPPIAPPLRELAGHYVGPGRGRVVAAFEAQRLQCEIGSGGDNGRERIYAELASDARGRPLLSCAAPQLSLAFFQEPWRGDTGLMLGLSAFKRIPHGRA
jgi:CubicO group peptidase (beta-lactamase class C family)